jgi:hypothetical protein
MDRQDINYDVDFERARECLDAEAGRLFRGYLIAQKNRAPDDIAQARAVREACQWQTQVLRPSDEAAIRAVLEAP